MTSPNLGDRPWRRDPESLGDDRHGIGVIDEATCLDLVERQSVGRLGFSARAMPVIFPINFLLVRRSVVFRTEPGQKLDAARQSAVACFEVDEFDKVEHRGWSVLVTGRLAVVEGRELERLGPLPLRPWAISEPSAVVTLSAEFVSGRSVGPVHGGWL